MSKTIAAIDVGTSRIKGAVFDTRGKVVNTIEAPMPAVVLNGRAATQDLAAIEALAFAIWTDLQASRPSVLALTTQRGTSVAVGKAHEAQGPLISWLDRRPRGELAGPHGLRSLHAQLSFLFTGRALETVQTGIESEAVEMAPIGRTQDMLAMNGMRLVVCGGDKNSELFGAGCFRAGDACLSLGTAISLGMLMDGRRPDPPQAFTTMSHLVGTKQVEVGLPYGGEIPRWLERTLGGEACRRLGATYPEAEGPLFFPYLVGSLADSQAKERWTQVTAETAPTQKATAAMAGIVLEVSNQVAQLPAELTRLTVVGGGSLSPYLVQWFADALQLPLMVRKSPDSGLHGAAMVAAMALGLVKNWAEASEAYAVPEAGFVYPDPGRAGVWKRLLERFREELGCISG